MDTSRECAKKADYIVGAHVPFGKWGPTVMIVRTPPDSENPYELAWYMTELGRQLLLAGIPVQFLQNGRVIDTYFSDRELRVADLVHARVRITHTYNKDECLMATWECEIASADPHGGDILHIKISVPV